MMSPRILAVYKPDRLLVGSGRNAKNIDFGKYMVYNDK